MVATLHEPKRGGPLGLAFVSFAFGLLLYLWLTTIGGYSYVTVNDAGDVERGFRAIPWQAQWMPLSLMAWPLIVALGIVLRQRWLVAAALGGYLVESVWLGMSFGGLHFSVGLPLAAAGGLWYLRREMLKHEPASAPPPRAQ